MTELGLASQKSKNRGRRSGGAGRPWANPPPRHGHCGPVQVALELGAALVGGCRSTRLSCSGQGVPAGLGRRGRYRGAEKYGGPQGSAGGRIAQSWPRRPERRPDRGAAGGAWRGSQSRRGHPRTDWGQHKGRQRRRPSYSPLYPRTRLSCPLELWSAGSQGLRSAADCSPFEWIVRPVLCHDGKAGIGLSFLGLRHKSNKCIILSTKK